MKWIWLSVLLPFFLSAENLPFETKFAKGSIFSENASYDGNVLILDGSVKLEHALGQFNSGTARLLRETKDGPFTCIHLRDDVLILLKNRGKIQCARADFYFNELKGTLIPKLGDMVRFVHLNNGPLSLASRKAEVEFSREEDSLSLSKIEAKDTVQVKYGKEFFLTAESATYSNTKIPYVWASPHCLLTHYDDQVEAERVEVLPESAKLILSMPKGKLYPSAFSENGGVQFSCNKLIWEKAPQTLTLTGNVSVHENSIGDIYCEDELELRQREENGKWLLSSLTAKGKTELTYKLDADFTHLLKCSGKMALDQDRLVLTLESLPHEPLEYFHDQMHLSADQAELQYQQQKRSLSPKLLLLSGNIQLRAVENTTRCAVANQFAYFPEEKKIVLSAKEGENVLFWDKEQELSISAKEVHILRGEKKENIKGVGNVRFAFSNAENALLKKIFPFYHPKGGIHE